MTPHQIDDLANLKVYHRANTLRVKQLAYSIHEPKYLRSPEHIPVDPFVVSKPEKSRSVPTYSLKQMQQNKLDTS